MLRLALQPQHVQQLVQHLSGPGGRGEGSLMQCAGGECSLQDTPSSSCSIWIVAQWGTTDELLRQPRLTGPHGNRRSWPHLQPRVEDLYPVVHLQVIKHLHMGTNTECTEPGRA